MDLGIERVKTAFSKLTANAPNIIRTHTQITTPPKSSASSGVRVLAESLSFPLPPPAKGPGTVDNEILLLFFSSSKYTRSFFKGVDTGLSEFYDDYFSFYNNSPPPYMDPFRPSPPNRVASLTRGNSETKPHTRGVGLRRADSNDRSPSLSSTSGGGSIRRKGTRRSNPRTPAGIKTQNYYEFDEEGYFSGEHDEYSCEWIKIRVKVCASYCQHIFLKPPSPLPCQFLKLPVYI